MADSEDSEVDVCTVDDEDAAKNMHSGLTLVAAELFLSDGSTKGEEGITVYSIFFVIWSPQLIHNW